MTMEQSEKELLDIYERFELTKSAQGAIDFVRRNIGVGIEPVEFDLTKKDVPDFDVREFYVELVSDLKSRSF